MIDITLFSAELPSLTSRRAGAAVREIPVRSRGVGSRPWLLHRLCCLNFLAHSVGSHLTPIETRLKVVVVPG